MSEDVLQRVIRVIAETQHMPQEKISSESTFQELGIDSLDGINILFGIENEFGISVPDDAAKTMRSVRDVAEGVKRLIPAEGGI
jgi:acyl carrier protein